jgi:hypothetical protein
MTASPFPLSGMENKIRLIAIKSAGVAPQGAAPVPFLFPEQNAYRSIGGMKTG